MLAKNFVYILFLVVKKNIRNNFNPNYKKSLWKTFSYSSVDVNICIDTSSTLVLASNIKKLL